jgi:hypothetical protein
MNDNNRTPEHDRDRATQADDLDLESPLGLAGEPVARTADDIRASDDDESVRKRRARAGLGHGVEERRSTGLGDLLGDENDGVASIDMGYGGDGNAVKSKP